MSIYQFINVNFEMTHIELYCLAKIIFQILLLNFWAFRSGQEMTLFIREIKTIFKISEYPSFVTVPGHFSF